MAVAVVEAAVVAVESGRATATVAVVVTVVVMK
jgi:hypothetical protein